MSGENGKPFHHEAFFDQYSNYSFGSAAGGISGGPLGIEAALAPPSSCVGSFSSEYLPLSSFVDYGGLFAKAFDMNCSSSTQTAFVYGGEGSKVGALDQLSSRAGAANGGTTPPMAISSVSSSSTEGAGEEEFVAKYEKDAVKEEENKESKGDDELDGAGEGDDNDKAKKVNKTRKKGEKRQREPRFAFRTKSEVDHLEDGYRWRKYGQKAVKNSPYPRSYYRCTAQKCSVKKRVERSHLEPAVVITTYEGQHTHHCPANVRGSSHALAANSSAGFHPSAAFHPDALLLQHLANSTNSSNYASTFTAIPQLQLSDQHYDLLQDIFPSFLNR